MKEEVVHYYILRAIRKTKHIQCGIKNLSNIESSAILDHVTCKNCIRSLNKER